MKTLDGITPFFIVGSPRSGTTLLERLLNSHSQIFVPPETEFFRALAYEKAAEEQSGAIARFAAAYARWRPVQLLGVDAEDLSRMAGQSKTYRGLFMCLLADLAHRGGKNSASLVGEKTPLHIHHTDGIRRMFPDARFIAMVRDGRAVVASRMKHPRWNSNLVTFSREWVKDSGAIRRLREELGPSKVLIVRYEDVVLSPEREQRRVCKFLGVEFEPEMLCHYEKYRTGFDEYYQQPWMSKSTSAIDTSRAEGWREDLAGSATTLVEKMIRSELMEFGYEPATNGSALPVRLWLTENARDLSFRLARKLFLDPRPLLTP